MRVPSRVCPRRVAVLFGVLLAFAGCSPLPGRDYDFRQCWRIDGSVGLGGYVGIRVGDVLHTGAGLAVQAQEGCEYGHFVLGSGYGQFGIGLLHADGFFRGGGEQTPDNPDCGICAAILPGLYNGHPRSDLHHFDIEFSIVVGLFGAQVGFSPGEFVDWIAGFFGKDLDPPQDEGDQSKEP